MVVFSIVMLVLGVYFFRFVDQFQLRSTTDDHADPGKKKSPK